MAISDTQKVDLLWKKVGFSKTKTDTNANKKAPNEAIVSDLIIKPAEIWSDVGSIPSTIPASNTSILEYIQEQKQQRTEPQQTIEHGRLELLTGYHQSLVLHIN